MALPFRLAILLLTALPALTPDTFPPGRLIERVDCLQDPAQNYSLYLPTGYGPERSWPILFCFDPGGRGAIPVQLFREGAETHGWILIGSNNARNGPWDVIIRAMRALWNDARARLRIDEARVHAAGFSGGARAAFAMGPVLSIRLAGVIACGGGLPEWIEPGDVATTPWFGTVGYRDFNYREMMALERAMSRQGTPCIVRVFQGEHRWPPVRLAREAIAWLEARTAERPASGGSGPGASELSAGARRNGNL